jgi:protein-tyrosine-phosphatase
VGLSVAELRRLAGLVRRLPGPVRGRAIARLVETPTARRQRLLALRTAPPARLVFVCHGNIMRSAYAECHARELIPWAGAHVASAGTHAAAGRPAHPDALAAAAALGTPLEGHTATPLHALVCHTHDVFVCMDRANEAHVLAWAGEFAPRVFLIGDVPASGSVAAASREVRDPYALGADVTTRAFVSIRAHVAEWVRLLPRPS